MPARKQSTNSVGYVFENQPQTHKDLKHIIYWLSLSLLPPGFSQQQITLCKGDLHLQKDGRRVSAPALHSLSLQPNAHIWFTDCLMLVVHKNGENFLNMIWLTGFMQYLGKSVVFISPPGIKVVFMFPGGYNERFWGGTSLLKFKGFKSLKVIHDYLLFEQVNKI